MRIAADLHTHTTASDGLLSPARLVHKAAEIGLVGLAVTDHDALSGIEEAILAGAGKNIAVLPGIELSTDYRGEEIHILGYGIDYAHDALLDLCKFQRRSRSLRAEKILTKLKALGYDLTMDDVLRQAKNAPPARPHIARALTEKKLMPSVGEAFQKLLDKGKPAYVDRRKITPAQAITGIRKAGGIAAWAHPGLTNRDGFLQQFIALGLRGLEVYHPDHTPTQVEHYRKLADNLGLLICGGSDFHAADEGRAADLGAYGLNKQQFAVFMRTLA